MCVFNDLFVSLYIFENCNNYDTSTVHVFNEGINVC